MKEVTLVKHVTCKVHVADNMGEIRTYCCSPSHRIYRTPCEHVVDVEDTDILVNTQHIELQRVDGVDHYVAYDRDSVLLLESKLRENGNLRRMSDNQDNRIHNQQKQIDLLGRYIEEQELQLKDAHDEHEKLCNKVNCVSVENVRLCDIVNAFDTASLWKRMYYMITGTMYGL